MIYENNIATAICEYILIVVVILVTKELHDQTNE